jgi:hypothetical protein
MTIESIGAFLVRAGVTAVPKPGIINRFIDTELSKISNEDLINLRIHLVGLAATQSENPVVAMLVTEVYEEVKHRDDQALSFDILKRMDAISGARDAFTPCETEEMLALRIASIAGRYLAHSNLVSMVHNPCVRKVLLLELNNVLDDAEIIFEGIEEVVEKFEDEVESREAAAVPMHSV